MEESKLVISFCAVKPLEVSTLGSFVQDESEDEVTVSFGQKLRSQFKLFRKLGKVFEQLLIFLHFLVLDIKIVFVYFI